MSDHVPDAADFATPTEPWVDLSGYRLPRDFHTRGAVVRMLWYFTSLLLFESGWFLAGGLKISILRLFGAKIGQGLVLKPNVRIKFPWLLEVGDHVWIGQDVWIDNLAAVSIGSHACVSQGSYFCTGGHDYRRTSFDLIVRPIAVGPGAWVGAFTRIMGGVTIGANAIVATGCIVTRDVGAADIVGGNPAHKIAQRQPPA
jgi:putative colanic acid biosynthesis acetyltransferase WcaF